VILSGFFNGFLDSDRERNLILCHHCLGKGCKHCQEGIIQHKGPIKTTQIPEFTQYVWLKNYNALPFAGGVLDQPTRFIKVVEWCDMVSSNWHKWQQAQEETKRKMLDMNRRKNGR